MWFSSSYTGLAPLPERMKDSLQLGFSSNHASYYLLFAEIGLRCLEIPKCLSSCWCNCLSINPCIKRVCHLKPGFTPMQLCRCDYPVHCIYKCSTIHLTETAELHQPLCVSCSRRMRIQGFCCTLFRVMWKRVALSLGFLNLTYLVLFLTI